MQIHLLYYLVLGICDVSDGRVHIVTNTVHHRGREAHEHFVTLTQWITVGSTASGGGGCDWVGGVCHW